jgi:hypothetical protein
MIICVVSSTHEHAHLEYDEDKLELQEVIEMANSIGMVAVSVWRTSPGIGFVEGDPDDHSR